MPHHRAQPELLVADDQVRVQARAQGAGTVVEAEHAGRVGAGRGGHVGDRQARGDGVPDDAGHGGGRAGDGAGRTVSGEARYSTGHVDPHRTEPVAAIRHPGSRHRVGDQDQPPRAGGAGREADRRVVQVHAVGDHLTGDLVPVEQRADRPRLAVMQRPHAVEQVRPMARAGVDGRRGDVRGGVGMADGGDDADPDCGLDQGGRPGKFGCEGDDAQMTRGRGVQALEGGDVRSDHVPRILGAAPGRGEEWSLQVDTGYDILAGQPGQHRGPDLKVGEGRGDQAGHDSRAAVPAVEVRGAPGVVGRSLGERRAAAPVHVHIDESRQHPVPAQVGDKEALPVRRLAGADGIDRVPGQPDPAGA